MTAGRVCVCVWGGGGGDIAVLPVGSVSKPLPNKFHKQTCR